VRRIHAHKHTPLAAQPRPQGACGPKKSTVSTRVATPEPMTERAGRNGETVRLQEKLVCPWTLEIESDRRLTETAMGLLLAAGGTGHSQRARRERGTAGAADDAVLAPFVTDQMGALRAAEQGRLRDARNFGNRRFHSSFCCALPSD